MGFIKTFFLTATVLASVLIGLIYSIDPYDKYGINVFGFETKAVAMARENKFNMVEHGRKSYEAFIIGSSSAHRIHTDDVKALTGLTAFNYAVQHTTPEDYLAITRHIFSKARPKLVLLQMDFYGLNKSFPTDTRFYTSPLKKFLENKPVETKSSLIDTDYLTLGAVSDSLKVIWVNKAGKVRHLYLEDGNYQKEKPNKGPVAVSQFGYPNYEIDQKRVALLKEIRELCEKNGARLIVWSAPYSLAHIEKIEKDPVLNRALTNYKLALSEAFGVIHDFTNARSVAAYNTEVYFRDSSHPKREFFKILLAKILAPKKKTLTSSNP